jgi:hypothetical protein
MNESCCMISNIKLTKQLSDFGKKNNYRLAMWLFEVLAMYLFVFFLAQPR